MSTTLQSLLGGVKKIGAYETIKGGLPNYLPDVFMRPTQQVIGNTFTFDKITGSRSNARLTTYGSPAIPVQQLGLTTGQATMLHTKESLTFNMQTLIGLQDSNRAARKIALDRVARQVREFERRTVNARISSVQSILAKGVIFINATGDLLPDASGAVISIDFGLGTAFPSATWATAGTDIIGDIATWTKSRAQTGNGLPIMHAFYGKSVPGYIGANTVAKEFIRGDSALAREAFLTGTIPQGFCGIQWHPVTNAYYIKADGTVQDWFGDKQITFCPEPSPDWYEFAEGSEIVPDDIGAISGDAVQSAGGTHVAFGAFSYAKQLDTNGVVSVVQYSGDTWLPLITNGSACLKIADVTATS